VVEIDKDMLEMIQKLSLFSAGEANARSLFTAKAGAKKRKRKEFEQQQELQTKLDMRHLKKQQMLSDPFGFQMPKRALPKH
jgi:hypothetical protein